MTDIDERVRFDAEPEVVWAVLTDLDRLGDWVSEHRGFPDGAPAELAEGVTYRQTVAAAGQEIDLEWTVVEADGPRRLRFEGSGPAGSTATLGYDLAPAGDGTELRYATSFKLPGGALGSLAGGLASPGEDDARRTLERLRTLVER